MLQRLKEAFESGLDYHTYRNHIAALIAQGKTTGPKQSEDLIAFTDLNAKRMDRGEKTVKLPENVSAAIADQEAENWLVLTEGWCGDAAQVLPVLATFEDAAPNIHMRMIMRDENLDIMDEFLTNGTRGIPKLIRLNADFTEVLGSWGPRPADMQAIVDEWKRNQDEPKSKMYVKLHGAYARDRGQKVIEEISTLLEQRQSQTV